MQWCSRSMWRISLIIFEIQSLDKRFTQQVFWLVVTGDACQGWLLCIVMLIEPAWEACCGQWGLIITAGATILHSSLISITTFTSPEHWSPSPEAVSALLRALFHSTLGQCPAERVVTTGQHDWSLIMIGEDYLSVGLINNVCTVSRDNHWYSHLDEQECGWSWWTFTERAALMD